MMAPGNNIQIVLAQSILGLKPTGVEKLGEALLAHGLAKEVGATYPVLTVPTFNHLYSDKREKATHCINQDALLLFSESLAATVSAAISQNHFPIVLGGDCSILIGAMAALKSKGDCGLLFFDAHADFYEPEKSVTGEAADMDLAIVTGRGPEALTNISHLKPYVKDQNIIHIGQRDWEETQQYGSRDIRETAIQCFSLEAIRNEGAPAILRSILDGIGKMEVGKFWIHFDADVLSDDVNPAVDYRLPGGLDFEEMAFLLSGVLHTGKISGMSVTVFNPEYDTDGHIAKSLVECLRKAFNS